MRWKRAASLLAFVVLLLAGVLALLALPKGHQSLGKVPVALAVDQRTARAFVANYGSDTVSILDATTGLVQRTQPVAGHPLAIAVDVRDARVVVASEGPPDSRGPSPCSMPRTARSSLPRGSGSDPPRLWPTRPHGTPSC